MNPYQTLALDPSRTTEGQDRLEGIRGGGPETPQGVDPLTDFLLDTVALVRHLEDSLPDGADRVFREAEGGRSRLFLPEIALGEFLYVALRGRLRASNNRSLVDEVLDQIRASGYLVLSAMSAHAWDLFLDLEIPELHDRMIAAAAWARSLPVVTRHSAFRPSPRLR